MANYFILRRIPSLGNESVQGYMEIEDWDGIEGFEDWGRGILAKNRPAGPIEIRAVPHDGYAGLPDDLQDGEVPLMSRRLKEVIESAGVDNIYFMQIALRNSDTNETYDYFAFNLVGMISAIDFGKSNVVSYDGDFVGDTQIVDLAIDESRCRDLLMFRIKEKFSAILVHQRIKEAIEHSGIATLRFINPEDFMAL
jgi:hypothetical protein